jgi:hypothetical protein
MNDQVLELICKLANKLREYEYEAANRGDTDEGISNPAAPGYVGNFESLYSPEPRTVRYYSRSGLRVRATCAYLSIYSHDSRGTIFCSDTDSSPKANKNELSFSLLQSNLVEN